MCIRDRGIQAFDNRLIAIDEFHHVSSSPDNKLGNQLGALIARNKTHLVAMTGSYFRGDSEAVLAPADEARFETITYTYYEQLNGYQWLKSLDIGYFFYTGAYVDAVAKVLDPALKTIVHIPNVNARESLKDKQREVDEIMHGLGEWKGIDPVTGFHLIAAKDGRTLRVADLVDDSDPARRSKVLGALKDPAQKNNRDNVDVIIALRRKGLAMHEAILQGMRQRLRPILMTTATTVLGIIPLVFEFGTGSELVRALTVPIVGGLVTSTIFTVVAIPVGVSFVEKRVKREE